MITLLERGLKFCPTPHYDNLEQRQQDINEFCRTLRLKEFFHNREGGSSDISMIKNKSQFEPEPGRNKLWTPSLMS